jgi:hypothetical protein
MAPSLGVDLTTYPSEGFLRPKQVKERACVQIWDSPPPRPEGYVAEMLSPASPTSRPGSPSRPPSVASNPFPAAIPGTDNRHLRSEPREVGARRSFSSFITDRRGLGGGLKAPSLVSSGASAWSMSSRSTVDAEKQRELRRAANAVIAVDKDGTEGYVYTEPVLPRLVLLATKAVPADIRMTRHDRLATEAEKSLLFIEREWRMKPAWRQ